MSVEQGEQGLRRPRREVYVVSKKQEELLEHWICSDITG